MKKQFLFLLLLLILIIKTVLAEGIIITQVLYNPLTESGSEAVELYNSGTNTINISGWTISTETSSTDAVIPQNTILRPQQYYLVADTGWSLSRDNLSWPMADHEEALTLANTDAGVSLSNTTHLVDAVGWGNPLSIMAGLFEGTPHPGATEGLALQRIYNNNYSDSDNNSADFIVVTPDFHNSSGNKATSGSEIKIVAIVTGAVPAVNKVTLLPDDDATTTGIQIAPVPKSNKTLTIKAQVSDPNGNNDISSVTATVNSKQYQMTKKQELNSTTAIFQTSFNMSYFDTSANYTANVTAVDKSNYTATFTTNFEYLGLVAVEIDAKTLTFAAMPGEYSEIIGDQNITTDNATVWNIGNSVIDLKLWGTNLTTTSTVIDIKNLEYSFGTGYNTSYSGKITNVAETKNVNIAPNVKQPLTFKLNIPLSTTPGNYSGSIYIEAVRS
jgi:hypothetical protein